MTENERTKVAISIWFCIIAAILVSGFYFNKFGADFNSLERSDFGTFGDYIGGLLNPIFAAANLVVLVYISLWVAGNERQREEREEKLQKTVAFYAIRHDAVTKLLSILDKVHMITLGPYNENVKFEMGKVNIELGVFLATNNYLFPALVEYDKKPIGDCIDRIGLLTQEYFSAITNVNFGVNIPLDPNRANQEKAAMLEEMQKWNELRSVLAGILFNYIKIE